MADQVSWFVIEPGWKVVDSNGAEIGRVEEILGDSNADIFDGLLIVSGLFSRPRYVPSEHVSVIVEGEVRLKLDHSAVERLGESKGSEHGSSPASIDEAEHVGLLRRALVSLGLVGRR